MNFNIEEKIASVEDYQKLRSKVGWHNHDRNAVEDGLKASIFFVCAVMDEEIIGIGRVVGDGNIYFYIQDVIVSPEHQGKGIGVKIIDYLNQLILTKAVPGAFVGLMAAEGLVPLYEKFGFKTRSSDKPGMEKWIYA